MTDKTVIPIDLGDRSYDIHIAPGLLDDIAECTPYALSGRNVFIITDNNVARYADIVRDALIEHAKKVEIITLAAGEKTKSYDSFEQTMDQLLEKGLNRSCLIVALGGGVIGDLAGFLAATAMRGVPFVQVPTSLLAQVDSSVGGKTGINSKHGKNLVGAFYQPISVVMDLDVLKTLPRRELQAGFAEIVKYGLLGDAAFFAWLEENHQRLFALDEEALTYAIAESCQAKARIVEQDEREGGKRALLNLGHTFGHALEAAAGYDGRLLHGEGVAIGIVMAYDLSRRLGYASEQDCQRAESLFKAAGMMTRAHEITPVISSDIDTLLGFMAKDKKVKDGKMTFVLADGIGNSFTSSDVPEAHVRDTIDASFKTK